MLCLCSDWREHRSGHAAGLLQLRKGAELSLSLVGEPQTAFRLRGPGGGRVMFWILMWGEEEELNLNYKGTTKAKEIFSGLP